ncbi:MAG: bifunctional nuclease family protein [Pseudonocardiales bacterium]|nr:bifunctional nuclease family protein [Pseudonocardiales bacterium]
MSEMTMLVIGWDVGRDAPVLLIQESGPARRVLAVDIDLPEAIAIAAAVDDDAAEPDAGPPRPSTHELVTDILDAFDHRLDHVQLTAVPDGTVQATLVLDHDIPIAARPGDALAVALRQHRPIHATDEVLDRAATDENTALIALAEEADDAAAPAGPDITEAEISRFRAELDAVDPDDLNAD